MDKRGAFGKIPSWERRKRGPREEGVPFTQPQGPQASQSPRSSEGDRKGMGVSVLNLGKNSQVFLQAPGTPEGPRRPNCTGRRPTASSGLLRTRIVLLNHHPTE